MIRLWRRRTPPADNADLDRAHKRVSDLEERADKSVAQVLSEGARNGFADRWRATIHHRPPPA